MTLELTQICKVVNINNRKNKLLELICAIYFKEVNQKLAFYYKDDFCLI